METKAFTELESAVINWFILFYRDEALSGQLRGARVIERKWTEVGWYVELHVQESAGPVQADGLGYGGWPIEGPQIRSSAIPHDAGVLLWGEQGIVDCIEMFAYAGEFPIELDQFELIKTMTLKPKP
ncbi:MAG: hypothetical protein ABTQ25_16730 [Nitrosomonas ureae]